MSRYTRDIFKNSFLSRQLGNEDVLCSSIKESSVPGRSKLPSSLPVSRFRCPSVLPRAVLSPFRSVLLAVGYPERGTQHLVCGLGPP